MQRNEIREIMDFHLFFLTLFEAPVAFDAARDNLSKRYGALRIFPVLGEIGEQKE